METSGFSFNLTLPDLWQQEAVRHIKAGRDVIVDAPTGAGKTWIFELLIDQKIIKGQSVYTVPTRALANDKRAEWLRKGWQTGIQTGEISDHADAPVVVATLETQRERLLRGDGPALLVIDEYQMLADPVRGLAYELAIALAPKSTRLLLLSGSVANAKDVADWMKRLGREAEVVSTRTRPVPLDELPVELLPRRAPKRITGFWPRLAAEVLMADAAPLLIFAPRRNDAEKIARQIHGALPTPDELKLTLEQQQILGPDLSQLLRGRIAVHHSGLGYQQRAGIIEPLAKAGQLRVIVATTGLAAGINFSVRSVIVADTHYHDGKCERELTPDELLQMFGRAGRRGLDEVGYVITAARTPRLGDASPRHLRRSNQVDWPSLLRIMHHAAQAERCPFDAARQVCASLFSKQKVVLGFDGDPAGEVKPPSRAGAAPARNKPETVRPDQHTMFGLGPTLVQVFNSRGEWEEKKRDQVLQGPLADAWVLWRNAMEPALTVYHFVSESFPVGRVCRIEKNGKQIYGREVALATEKSPRRFALTRNIREITGLEAGKEYSIDQLDEAVLPLMEPHLYGGRVAGMVQRQEVLALQLDFSGVLWPMYEDRHGAFLVAPDERTVAVEENVPRFVDKDGAEHMAGSHTAAYAWRKLGLIEENGHPTARGVIFSLFHAGEGLAIAAALEDKSYPLPALALHIANLRGGRRFSETREPGESERLATVCLQTYGAANFDGYLDGGLPAGYGAGAAEILQCYLTGKGTSLEQVGPGDMERAFTEWLSLLRQISNAPSEGPERWQIFRGVCAGLLRQHAPQLPSRTLPDVPAEQLVHQPRHRLVLQA